MMGAAERDRKLIADPTPQGARLHEPQVMRVRGAASAHEAGLRGNEFEVRAVAVAARFTQRERAFVDMPGDGIVHPLISVRGCRNWLNPCRRRRNGRHLPARPSFAGAHHTGSFAREALLPLECWAQHWPGVQPIVRPGPASRLFPRVSRVSQDWPPEMRAGGLPSSRCSPILPAATRTRPRQLRHRRSSACFWRRARAAPRLWLPAADASPTSS